MTIAGVSLILILVLPTWHSSRSSFVRIAPIKVRMQYHEGPVALAVTAFVHAVLAYLSGL